MIVGRGGKTRSNLLAERRTEVNNRMRKRTSWLIVLTIAVCGQFSTNCEASDAVTLRFEHHNSDASALMRGRDARLQMVLSAETAGAHEDLTRTASFRADPEGIVQIEPDGLVTPLGNGTAKIIADGGDGRVAETSIEVSGVGENLPISFPGQIVPIFTKLGCNGGGCHGKIAGQNGFKLSLLGFEPQEDYEHLVRESRGRRVSPATPDRSLLLTKAINVAPHGGGQRLERDSHEYRMLRRWIVQGMPYGTGQEPTVTSIEVFPKHRRLRPEAGQQLSVIATYSDGSVEDVTRATVYESNDTQMADVTAGGLVQLGNVVGDAAVMARYQGHVTVFRADVPLPGESEIWNSESAPGERNEVDKYVFQKLRSLGIPPSPPCDDATYLRRAYIDVIGRPPTSNEARTFLKDETPSAKKREALIDDLLGRPEYADFWANKWVDLLRPNPYRVGIKAVFNYDNWIRDAFRKKRPYNEFVYDLVTASGSTFREGAITLYRDRRAPDEITTMVSQLFLGIRLDCARCHHHPFEVWGQDDFYGFAAYFAQIGRKGTGLSPPISGSEEFVFNGGSGSVRHPLTGAVVEPKPLFGEAPSLENGRDRRIAVAEWMTSPENQFFEQTMANRVWADLMGRGLVEPVDDIRATNPASNPELMAALGKDFREQGYDVKKLIRRICLSYVYGLSSSPSDRNSVDTRNYSRFYRQRLRAEVMLDAAVSITGVPETFRAMPPNTRATEIWTHRISSLFLDAFGRPDLNQDPPCERTTDTSVVQVLHLMNAENLAAKVTNETGRVSELAKSDLTPAQIVEELYLSVYSRFPSDDETKMGVQLFEAKDAKRREVIEDLLWALLNTPEFVFKK